MATDVSGGGDKEPTGAGGGREVAGGGRKGKARALWELPVAYLPRRHPLIGWFHHASSGDYAQAKYFEELTSSAEYRRIKAIRQNPHVGILVEPESEQLNLRAVKRELNDIGFTRFIKMRRKIAQAEAVALNAQHHKTTVVAVDAVPSPGGGWKSSYGKVDAKFTPIVRSVSDTLSPRGGDDRKADDGSSPVPEFVPIGVGVPGDDVLSHFKLGKRLGSGEFATVYAAERIVLAGDDDAPMSGGAGEVAGDAKEPDAVVKAIKKRYLISVDEREAVVREVRIHSCMHHPNIVQLYDTYEGKDNVYLVLERVQGIDMARYLNIKRRIPESEAKMLFAGILAGVAYIHKAGAVHCDLKPANIMLQKEAVGKGTTLGVGYVPKIVDFGAARHAKDARYYKKTGSVKLVPCEFQFGTPGYMPPEILNTKPFSNAVDMWAVGVILYTMLSGLPPFRPHTACTERDVAFPAPFWTKVSASAQDLVRKLLEREPTRRISAQDALAHRWLNK